MNLMKNKYLYNSNFKKYVDEYCNKNAFTVDEAFNDQQVKTDVLEMIYGGIK